ncbi:MAG TPA: molybdopterin converting factor subunit 1 [Myxococcota bacterium]|jgi:molybdopterin synthase catalytic subunit
MNVTVRLFGSLREATGAKELAVSLPGGASVADLFALLAADHAAFEALGPKLRVAVNQDIVGFAHALAEADEVAFLPPVSGGAEPKRCWISEQPLDPGAVVNRVLGPDAGGIVTFVGTVREESRGHAIRRLEYEAYPEMAERELEKICDEAAQQWGARVAVAHRIGVLPIGEIAVVVAAAAKHRAEAFAACRYTIDTLKQRVPIWKKEFAESGEYWVEDHA